MKQFYREMLTADADDETSVVYSPGTDDIPNGYTHEVEWGTSVSAGVVQIEGTNISASYAGTWSPIHTFTYASGSPKAEYVYSSAQFKHMRHRISTAITGGTVSSSISGAR